MAVVFLFEYGCKIPPGIILFCGNNCPTLTTAPPFMRPNGRWYNDSREIYPECAGTGWQLVPGREWIRRLDLSCKVPPASLDGSFLEYTVSGYGGGTVWIVDCRVRQVWDDDNRQPGLDGMLSPLVLCWFS